ncbi:hypothetical protein ACQ4M4_04705 [Leptolyngbya sp. AN02str]|uniref:hypothetical protein n=1 Tax=Leptolyngbya sp. AN02str TaxID=3423363 RepID=UPI003D31472C
MNASEQKVMGKYCKAYLLKQLRQFDQWAEQVRSTRSDQQGLDEQTGAVSQEMTDDDILYLQENYVVTHGVFLNEDPVFDCVSPEWIIFCKEVLNFAVPDPTAANQG